MKHEEAIKILRETHDNALFSVRTALETICPELVESDDESTRKALIETVKCIYAGDTMFLSEQQRDRYLDWLEKQKENPKSADSIPSDCTSDVKCEDRWYKVTDSLPDNGRLVLAKDCLGNVLLARYDGENWEVNVYDNEDHYCHNSISKWCEIPSEKQKESLHIPETSKENANSFTDEDERIRRTLVEYFGPKVQLDFVRGVPIKKIRAWLEKQKEQKPLHWRKIEDATTQRTDDGCCVTSEKMLVKGWINDGDYRIVDEGTMVNRDILCIPVRELNAEQKERKPAESISQRTVQGKGVYKICPRCKERMIRDDSMVYTSMPPQYRYECPKCGESECDTVMYDNPEMEEQKPWKVGENAYFDPNTDMWFIKKEQKPNIELIQQSWYMEGYHDREFGKEPKWILKTGEGGPKHELNPKYGEYIKKEQKPEWSEEDEEMLNDCIMALSNWRDAVANYGHEVAPCQELIDWLKSLRPSWKPSEEQMKALESCGQCNKQVYSLYLDLKKL